MLRNTGLFLVMALILTRAAWAGVAGVSTDVDGGGNAVTTTSSATTTTSSSHNVQINDIDLGRKHLGDIVKGSSTNSWHANFKNEYVYGKLHASAMMMQAIGKRNGGGVETAVNTYLAATDTTTLPSNEELFTANLGSPNAWLYYNGEVDWYTRGVRFQNPTKLDGFNSASVTRSMYNGRGTVYSNAVNYAGTQEYVVNQTTTQTDQVVTQNTTEDVSVSTTQVASGDYQFATVTNVHTNTNVDTHTAVTESVTSKTGVATVGVYEATAQVGISPIVLDLSGTGTLDASNGDWMPHRGVQGKRLAMFDINANGLPMLMEWVGPKAGLLVEPRKDGTVDGTCLFGTTGGFEDGFEKLALRDANNDGRLTGKELAGLSVWVDANGNARAEKSEIRAVQALAISELGVRHDAYKSSFVMGGRRATMWDWWPTAVDVRKVRLARR